MSAPLFTVIDVRARIVPTNTAFVSMLAVLSRQ